MVIVFLWTSKPTYFIFSVTTCLLGFGSVLNRLLRKHAVNITHACKEAGSLSRVNHDV
jgi:hypothetical protein